MWDVYLGGISDPVWRKNFKDSISKDVKIYDPYIENYKKLKPPERQNQSAKELSAQNNCAIIVFYLKKGWRGTSTLLELGMATGCGKQVIMCIDGNIKGKKQIISFCNYHGILVCNSINDLVLMVEEFIMELSSINET